MNKFKINQQVVHSVSKTVVTIEEFGCCPGCGQPTLYLKGYDRMRVAAHTTGPNACGYESTVKTREHYTASYFEAPFNTPGAIQYKLNVTIPELTHLSKTHRH